MKELDISDSTKHHIRQTAPQIFLVFIAAAVLVGGYHYLQGVSSNTSYPVATTLNTTPKQNKLEAKIATVGDIACRPDVKVSDTQCQMAAVANDIVADNPDAVLILGDLQYERGEPENFTKVFAPTWSPLKERSYAAPGNHEYATKDAAGYFDYWNGPDQTSKQAGERGKGYYSFTLGSWHIIALNSNCKEVGGCEVDSMQGKWLAADLSEHKDSRCTLAFWHHPRFSSGRYKTYGYAPDFWNLLYAARADVILNGHDHLYERFAKQKPDGTSDPVHGIRQFTVGTGGKTLYQFSESFLPNHEFGSDNQFGFLTLRLYESGYSWLYKTIDGNELDKGSSSCSS